MRYRMMFAAGLAVGYVLGARAGRERYEQIKRAARRVADSPAVQEAAGLVGAQVGKVTGAAKKAVRQRVPFFDHDGQQDTGLGWPPEERKPQNTPFDGEGTPY